MGLANSARRVTAQKRTHGPHIGQRLELFDHLGERRRARDRQRAPDAILELFPQLFRRRGLALVRPMASSILPETILPSTVVTFTSAPKCSPAGNGVVV